jgi:hypothetical protein
MKARSKALPKQRVVDPSTRLKVFDVREFILSLSSFRQSRAADQVRASAAGFEFKKLVASRVDPCDYSVPPDFAADYLLCSLVKKYQNFDLGIDREQAAFEKWLEAEESCRRTNYFFRVLASGGIPFPHRVLEIFHLAQCKIAKILGDVSYSSIKKSCQFGPGSDLSTDGDFTSSYNKYKTSGSATPWILGLFSEIFSEDRREDFLHECQFVKGNRLSFVPKTAVIDRAICVEPRWNIYLQSGIGDLISQRLKRYGLDIKDQSRNQELARLAHVYGLATIDLSSASDTVSTGLVQYLLPDDWSDLIFKTRCPYASYRGKEYRLEKVSSMGNGFTFPLESLIFFALCEATCDFEDVPRCIGTFGDDLIVPKEVTKALVEVLSYAGFSVNTEKSFVEGNFFESCGKDYFKGVNVRPFFIKRKVSSVLDHMILANQITEYCIRLPEVAAELGLFEARDRVISLIPPSACLRGPVGMAGVVHSSFDECTPPSALGQGWDGYWIKTWVASPKKFQGNDFNGHLFSKLSDDVDSRNGFTTRNSIRWKRKTTYVPTYGDFLRI